MRTTIKRTALAVITAIALLATVSGQALAGGPAGLAGPADIDSLAGSGPYHLELLNPWEHTVIVVHVTDGDFVDGGDPVDINEIVGSPEDYINGRVMPLVDLVITHYEGLGAGYWTPHGFFGDKPWSLPDSPAGDYGRVAWGLWMARNVCDLYWSSCDVVLVTYQAPEDPDHRRQAMAEAMLLNQVGQLHTIAVEDGLNDLDHVEFSSLLGALGNHAQAAGQEDFVFYFDHMVQPTIVVPVDSDWPEEEIPTACEVYDPDSNCYYGPDGEATDDWPEEEIPYAEDYPVECDEIEHDAELGYNDPEGVCWPEPPSDS